MTPDTTSDVTPDTTPDMTPDTAPDSIPEMTEPNVRDAIPAALVELLSGICGVVTIGALNGRTPTVEGTVSRDGQTWMCQASVYVAGAILLARSVWPDTVPPERRPDVARLIARVNWGLLAGSAELDHRDGTVRVRTSLCPAGQAVGMRLAEGLVLPNLGTAALLFPRVASVAAGADDPDQAAERLLDDIESGALVLHR